VLSAATSGLSDSTKTPAGSAPLGGSASPGRGSPAEGSVPPRPPGGSPPQPPRGGPPPPPPPPPPDPEPAPGLGEQIGATRDSAKRLLDAHVELAKAELEEISGAAKRAAGFGGIAAGLGIFALLLLAIGGPMFLGEWL